MRRAALHLVLAVVAGACSCEEPTEEERLREMVDTTSVHLYVAMKIAVTKTGDDPEVRAARERLLEMLAAMQRLARERQGAPAESMEEALARMVRTGGDAVALAQALWELRAQGAEVVRTRREDELSPVLPVLLADRAPELLAHYDMNTEHGVMLLAFFVLKFHPKSPTPIPNEVLLYEAWMTDAGSMKLPGLIPPVRSVKAYLYSQNDLCDLAQAEASALAEEDGEERRQQIMTTLRTLGSSPEEDEVRSFAAATRALAHGSTAMCYMDRGEDEKAREELEKFVDSAEAAGIPPEDTALVRAYLAYHDGDIGATRRYLEQAKQSEMLDDRDREDIDELLGYLRETENRDALTDFYDEAFFATFTVRLVFRQLERSGLAEDLEQTPLYQAAYAWVTSAGRTIGAARDAIPSFSDAADEGRGWLESLFE